MVAPALFVIVSGPPGSGKSTLAPELARELGLPLVAKDTIKEAIMSVLPIPDVDASRQLGLGCIVAMLAVAAESPIGAVLESNFRRSLSAGELARLPGEIVEIFCRCDPETQARRYRERAETRHAGHFDAERTVDDLWNEDVTEPVDGGWPVLEVQTDHHVDIAEVLEFVRRAVT